MIQSDVDAAIYYLIEKIPWPIRLTDQQIYDGISDEIKKKYPDALDNDIRARIESSSLKPKP